LATNDAAKCLIHRANSVTINTHSRRLSLVFTFTQSPTLEKTGRCRDFDTTAAEPLVITDKKVTAWAVHLYFRHDDQRPNTTWISH
jgi:hypothetical protein